MTSPEIGMKTQVAPHTGGHARENFSGWVERLACATGDGEELRHRKVQFTITSFLVVPAGVIWGLIYFLAGEKTIALIPWTYATVTAIGFFFLLIFRNYEIYRQVQQGAILVLPAALQVALGGFVGGSNVIFWSFIAVLSALLFGSVQEAFWWFVAYCTAIAVTAFLTPGIAITNHLSRELILIFFVLNLATVSTVLFVVLHSFVTDRRKLRELELAYLNQEMMLRQSEKLATLGTLAAGVAHELNNPAAATRRAAEQMQEAFARLEEAHTLLSGVPVTGDGREQLRFLEIRMRERAASPSALDTLSRSDREAALEEWLEQNGVPDTWAIAPPLVAQGLDPDALASLKSTFEGESLTAVLRWAASAFPVYTLLHEIQQGTSRLSEIVGALKGYAYLGQAPVQEVNIHESLDNTLVMLRSKLRDEVTVQRDYGTDVPSIVAYGTELNQVWTNLILNAVDAMNGKGMITISTHRDNGNAVVQIQDNGTGIPESIRTKIFDPFFTTKPPGKGTGLGLSTSHSIVTERHGGTITVESQPGSTRFTVRLPLEPPQQQRSSKE